VIQALQDTKLPVTSVDAPSSWDIENGPPKSGLGSSFMPMDRFVSEAIAKKYDFEIPEYQGIDQVAEVAVCEQKL
jgi:NAD(P)H-hydrate epimerase